MIIVTTPPSLLTLVCTRVFECPLLSKKLTGIWKDLDDPIPTKEIGTLLIKAHLGKCDYARALNVARLVFKSPQMKSIPENLIYEINHIFYELKEIDLRKCLSLEHDIRASSLKGTEITKILQRIFHFAPSSYQKVAEDDLAAGLALAFHARLMDHTQTACIHAYMKGQMNRLAKRPEHAKHLADFAELTGLSIEQAKEKIASLTA